MVIKNLLLGQKEQGPLPPSSLTKESSSGRDRCDHFEHIHWFDHFDQGYQQHSFQRDRCDHFDRGYQQHRYQWGSTLSLGYYPKLTSNHCPFHEQKLHPCLFAISWWSGLKKRFLAASGCWLKKKMMNTLRLKNCGGYEEDNLTMMVNDELNMLNCKINGTVHIFFLKKSYLSPRCPKLSHFFS